MKEDKHGYDCEKISTQINELKKIISEHEMMVLYKQIGTPIIIGFYRQYPIVWWKK